MKRAFSLIEVMVALGIVALLAGSVFAFMLDLLRGRDALIDATNDAVAAATIIEQLERDLLVSMAASGDEAGISGDVSSIRVRGRSVRLPVGTDDVIGDIGECEIRYVKAEWRLEGARRDGTMEEISSRVRACRFRYFDGEDWRSSFDSRAEGTLPVAIEIALWFGDPPPRDESLDETGTEWASEADAPREDELVMDPAGFEDMADELPEIPLREPDLLRVMIVPDGPTASWSDGA